MYRASEFTKAPVGQLDLQLESAEGLFLFQKDQEQKEYNPIMVFELGQQRLLVDEQLQIRKTQTNSQSKFKRWLVQKQLKLNTYSIYDALIIKFMNRVTDENGDVQNVLLGTEVYDISSLVLNLQAFEQKIAENEDDPETQLV